MLFGATTSIFRAFLLWKRAPATAIVVIVLPVPISMRKAQPLLFCMVFTVLVFLDGQRHVQLSVLSVRHDE